jgi:hypothetical protein
MTNLSMNHSRRAMTALGTAAIVLGGAVVAYSTQETTTKTDASERKTPESTKAVSPAPVPKADAPKRELRVQEKVQYKDYPGVVPPPFPEPDAVPNAPQRPVPAPVSAAVTEAVKAGQGIERVEKLLDRIERADRDERLRRWKEVFEFTEIDPTVVKKLEDLATGRSPAANRYVRYVAAANVAGFGMPTGIGPNSIPAGVPPLGVYITLHRGISIPRHKKRHIRLDPALENLIVVVPPNANNSLHFQEILWTILEKYHLDFRTEEDGTFMIVREKPPV